MHLSNRTNNEGEAKKLQTIDWGISDSVGESMYFIPVYSSVVFSELESHMLGKIEGGTQTTQNLGFGRLITALRP